MGELQGNNQDDGGAAGGGGHPACTSPTTPSPSPEASRRRSPRGGQRSHHWQERSGSPRPRRGGSVGDDDDGVRPPPKVHNGTSTSSVPSSSSISVSWTKTLISDLKHTLPSPPPPAPTRRRSPRRSSTGAGSGGDGGVGIDARPSGGASADDAAADESRRVRVSEGGDRAADRRQRAAAAEEEEEEVVVVGDRPKFEFEAEAEAETAPPPTTIVGDAPAAVAAAATTITASSTEDAPPPTTATDNTIEENGDEIAAVADGSVCEGGEEEETGGDGEGEDPSSSPATDGMNGDGAPTPEPEPERASRSGRPDPIIEVADPIEVHVDAPAPEEASEGYEGGATRRSGGKDRRRDDTPGTDGTRRPRGEEVGAGSSAHAGARASGGGGVEDPPAPAPRRSSPVSFVEDMEEASCEAFAFAASPAVAGPSPSPKRRGRPKGSKNNAKWTPTTTPVGGRRSRSRSRTRTPRSTSEAASPSTSAAHGRDARRARRTGTRTPRNRKVEEGDDNDDDGTAAAIASGRRAGVLRKRRRRARADADADSLHSDDDDDGAGSADGDGDGDGDGMPRVRCEGLCCRILRGGGGRRRSGRRLDKKKEEGGRRCVRCGDIFPRAFRMVIDAESALATSATLRDSLVASLLGGGFSDPSSSSSSSYRPTKKLTLRGLEDALYPVVKDLPSWSRSSEEAEDESSTRDSSSARKKSTEAWTMALCHISETLDLSLEAETEGVSDGGEDAAAARGNNHDDDKVEGRVHDSSHLLKADSERSHLEFIRLLRGDGDGRGQGGGPVNGNNGLIRPTSVPLLCECVPRKKVGFFGPPDEEKEKAAGGPQDAKGGCCCDRCGRLKRAPPHLHPHPHRHHVGDIAGGGVETVPPPPRCRACGGERGLQPPTAAASVGEVVVCGSCRLLSLATRNSLRLRLAAAALGAGVSISPSDFEEEERERGGVEGDEKKDSTGGGERDVVRNSNASSNKTKKRKFTTRRNTTPPDAGSPVSKRRTRGGECRIDGDGDGDGDGDDESISGMDDAQLRAPSEGRRCNPRRGGRVDEQRPATTPRTSNRATTRRKGGRRPRQQPLKKRRAGASRPSSSGKVRQSFKSSSLGEESPDEYSRRRTRARPARRASGGLSFGGRRNGRRTSNGGSSEECSSSSGGGSTSSSDDDDDDDESFVDKPSGSGRTRRRGRGNQCPGDEENVDKDGDGATSGGVGASPSLRFRDDVASKRNALRRAGRPQVEALSQLLDDLPRLMSPQLLLPTTAYAEDGTHGHESGENASRDAESNASRPHLDELQIISRIVQTRHAAGDYDGARRLCEGALKDYSSRARALISAAGSSSRGGANTGSRQEHVDGISYGQRRPSVASTSANGNGTPGHTLPDERYVIQCEMQRIVSGLWCLLASLVEHCPSSLHSSLVDGSGGKFVEKRRCVGQIHKLATRCEVANKGGAVWIAHGRFLAEENSTPSDNAEFVIGDDDIPGGKNHDAVDSVAGAINAGARDVLRSSLRASAYAVEKEVAGDPLIKSLTERASICNDLNLLTSATSHQRDRATFTDHAGVGRRVASNAAATDEREEGDRVGTSSFVRSLQLVCPSCRQQLESHEALREHSFGCSLSERDCHPNNAFGSTQGTRGPLVDIIAASTSTSTGRRSNSRSTKRNRVGIRCRPCHVASRSDGSGDTNTTRTPPHVTYPKSTSCLWEDVQRMYNDHLTSCPHVQPDRKGKKFGLDDDGSSSEFRWYWDAISRRLGFVAVTSESIRQDPLRAENHARTTGEVRNDEDGFGTNATVAACSGNSCSKRSCVDKAGASGKKRKWNWAADCVNFLGEQADGRLEMPSVRSARSKAHRERHVLSKGDNTNDHDVLDESSDEIRAGRDGDAPRTRMGMRLILESASQYWHDIRKVRALIPTDVGRAFYAQQSRAATDAGERELPMSPDAVRCHERGRRIREEGKRAVDKGVEMRNEGGPISSNDSAGISNVGDETDGALGGANDTLVDYDRDIEIATEYLLALYTHFVPCRTRPVEAEPHCRGRMYLCCKHCQKVVPSRGIPVDVHHHSVKYLRNHLLDECSEVSAPSKAVLRDLQDRREKSANSASFFQRVSERYCSAVSVTTTENRYHTSEGILAHPNSTASQGPSTAPNVPTCDANKDDIEKASLHFGQQVGEHKNDDLVEMSTGVNAVDVDGTLPCGDCSNCDSKLVCSTKNFDVTCNDGNTPCSGKRESCGQPEAIPRLPEKNPDAGIHVDSSLVGKSACSLNEFREAGMVSTSNFTPDPATVLPLEV